MTIRTHKWCKKGCGKRVVYNPLNFSRRVVGKSYVCEVCGKRYSREMLGLKVKCYRYKPSRDLISIREITRLTNN